MKRSLSVHQGKGKKDRVVPVSGRASAVVDLYLREGRPGLVRSPRQHAPAPHLRHAPMPRSSSAMPTSAPPPSTPVSFPRTWPRSCKEPTQESGSTIGLDRGSKRKRVETCPDSSSSRDSVSLST
jgi:hypothetical protein